MSTNDEVVAGDLIPAEVLASTGPVAVSAVIRVRSGSEAEYEALVASVIPRIRDEAGCEQYVVHAAVDQQGVYVVYERFATGPALARHLEEPFMQTYVGQVAELMDGPPDVTMLRPVAATR